MVLQIGLARVLAPHEFGIVAQAAVLTGFAALIAEFGVESAIAQAQELSDRSQSAAFWLVLVISSGLTAVVIGASSAIAGFFGESDLRTVVVLLAAAFPLQGLAAVLRGVLARRLVFRALAVIDATSFVISAVVVVLLALGGAGAISLAAQPLAAGSVALPCYLAATRWRPQRAALAVARPLLRPMAGLVGFNSVNYWARSADNLLIGRFLGAVSLGFYSRAYLIAVVPIAQLSWGSAKVMVPVLARLRNDAPRFRASYLRAVRLLAFLQLPLLFWLFVNATEVILVLLGSEWVEIAGTLRWLCLAGVVQAVLVSAGWIYIAMGRTTAMWWWGLVSTAVMVGGFYVGVRSGSTEAVAGAYAGSLLILAYPCLRIPFSFLSLGVAELLRSVVPIALVAAGLSVAIRAGWGLLDVGNAWMTLAVGGPLFLAGYALVCRAVGLKGWDDARIAFEMIRGRDR